MSETNSFLEKRQHIRKPTGYPVRLVLKDKNGHKLGDEVMAVIRDISSTGVGLVVSKILAGNRHFFYEPREKPTRLYLQYSTTKNQDILIELQPQWYRRGDGDESCYFYLGGEFSCPDKAGDIAELLESAQQSVPPPRKSWFASLFSL